MPLLVVLQRPLIAKDFVTLFAHELVITRVQSLVRVQTLFGHEAVHAAVAFVLSAAGHPVVLQRLTAQENDATDLAFVERSLLVDRRVVLQLAFAQELLVAHLTAVLGNGFVVQVAMLHEHVVGVENSAALFAGELTGARVSVADVFEEVVFVHEEFLTLFTVETTDLLKVLCRC